MDLSSGRGLDNVSASRWEARDRDPLELDFQRDFRRLTLVLAHVDVLQAFDAGLFHLGCNRMIAIACQSIDAAQEED